MKQQGQQQGQQQQPPLATATSPTTLQARLEKLLPWACRPRSWSLPAEQGALQDSSQGPPAAVALAPTVTLPAAWQRLLESRRKEAPPGMSPCPTGKARAADR